MKKFKASIYRIEEVEVEKETDFFVWVGNYRCTKHSPGTKYFDTIEEAKEFVKDECNERIELAENRLKATKKERDSIFKNLGINYEQL